MSNFLPRRRTLLRTAAGLSLGAGTISNAVAALPQGGGAQPDWASFASNYDIAPEFINLENAYYGILARPVAEDFRRNNEHLNRYNSYYMRREFDREGIEKIRATLAAYAGVPTNELALTRGATESLQNLICNYRLLKPGDGIMYANLDYGTMMDAMEDLARRSGATVAKVQIPEPASRQNIIDTYERALRDNPRTRLLLLTHISHRTGLVIPVAEIVRMAKQRNVDVIVDVAQSWGQLDYRISDFGADFVGANLHKWIGAPLGLGFLHIRNERLQDIGIERGNTLHPATDIRARVHAGTLNSAAIMTIPAALRFHASIPLAQRGARLRALRDRWVHGVLDVPNVQVLTPEDPTMYGAVTSFRLKGVTSFEDNTALSRRLADEFNIFTVPRNGPAGGSCIRVTPSFFTRNSDLDALIAAIRKIAGA